MGNRSSSQYKSGQIVPLATRRRESELLRSIVKHNDLNPEQQRLLHCLLASAFASCIEYETVSDFLALWTPYRVKQHKSIFIQGSRVEYLNLLCTGKVFLQYGSLQGKRASSSAPHTRDGSIFINRLHLPVTSTDSSSPRTDAIASPRHARKPSVMQHSASHAHTVCEITEYGELFGNHDSSQPHVCSCFAASDVQMWRLELSRLQEIIKFRPVNQASSNAICILNSVSNKLKEINLLKTMEPEGEPFRVLSSMFRVQSVASTSVFLHQARTLSHRICIPIFGNIQASHETVFLLKKAHKADYNHSSAFEEQFWCTLMQLPTLDHLIAEQGSVVLFIERRSIQLFLRLFPSILMTYFAQITSTSVSLLQCLRSTQFTQVFQKFCQLEHSEENLLFWLAIEDYETSDHRSTVDQFERAKELNKNFVLNGAINLNGQTSNGIKANCETYSNFNVNLFAEAKHSVYGLMRADSFPRFLKSQMFRDYLVDCTIESPSIESGTSTV